MPKLLRGGIAKMVYRGMKAAKMTMAATLIKVTAGTRTAGSLGAGTNPTEASYPAKGFEPDERAEKIADTLVEKNDRIVALFGASITGSQFPTTKDKITIDGETLRIIAVETEAAKAIYTCLCRK